MNRGCSEWIRSSSASKKRPAFLANSHRGSRPARSRRRWWRASRWKPGPAFIEMLPRPSSKRNLSSFPEAVLLPAPQQTRELPWLPDQGQTMIGRAKDVSPDAMREDTFPHAVPNVRLRSRRKFGQEIGDERGINGCVKKGHVAISLAAAGNQHELPVSNPLLGAIEAPEFRRV